jgi:mRNA interferase RelE/StbE
MDFAVKVHPNVQKFLGKLDKQLEERIINKFKLLKSNPFVYLEHYEGEKVYKLRIGDYRALIDVDMVRKIVFIRVLDHRKRIYKR